MAQDDSLAQRASRFPLDASAARVVAWTRVAAGGLALASGVWLLLLPGGWVLKAFAIAAVVFGALWVRHAAGGLRASPVEGWLEIGPEGIERVEGTLRERVAWRQLDEILIDHDRLELRLCRRNAPPLVIEPRYCQLGLDELVRRIEAARDAAARSDGTAEQTGAPAPDSD